MGFASVGFAAASGGVGIAVVAFVAELVGLVGILASHLLEVEGFVEALGESAAVEGAA